MKYKYSNLVIVYTLYDYVYKLEKNSEKAIQQLECSKVVRSFMYVMNCIRPDIAFSVSLLSRFTKNLSKEHWIAIERVMIYLKETIHYALHFTGYPAVIEGYSDASWGGEKDLSWYLMELLYHGS